MAEKTGLAEIFRKKNGQSDDMDPLMHVIKAMHDLAVKGDYVSAEDLERQRSAQDRFCRLVTPILGIDHHEFEIDGIPSEWSIPEFPHHKKHMVLYCHGGGYTCGNLNYARILAGKLAQHTGLETLSFAYRLAPENPYPAAFEDAMKVWDHLMYKGYGASDVIIAGDSAGGNMALEICLALKKAGRKMPGALILMSPWTDMTMSGQSYKTWREKDPLLNADYIRAVRGAYAGNEADFKDASFSPLFADLSGFPPTMIQVGSNEILRSDSEDLAKKLRQNGVRARLDVTRGGFHVFQMLPLPMSAKAMKEAGEFTGEIVG